MKALPEGVACVVILILSCKTRSQQNESSPQARFLTTLQITPLGQPIGIMSSVLKFFGSRLSTRSSEQFQSFYYNASCT
ncbi:hypothetical protein BD769DRAFT_1495899 [Suillus cothurnatus]|nr:hypothetical protein BD769DRAFT_1495899 [Suillus cothurnatus]